MAAYKGVEYLRNKLAHHRQRVLTRYRFYEMKNVVKEFNMSIPIELRAWTNSLGWCGRAVDSIADRLVFKEFQEDNFEIMEIFQMNNPDMFFDSAVLSAVLSSCCFVYISPDGSGFPRLQIINGGNATGVLDPITGLLTEGYAVLERDDRDNPITEAYLIKGITRILKKGQKPRDIRNNAPYPLLAPIIYRPDAKRPFGHSRISRACMGIQDAAVRTIKRSEISAEFYSYPQKWVTGLSLDAEPMEKWKATASSMLTFTKDEDGGGDVKVGQFAQQSMSPYAEQLRMFAALFAGETGLTLDDLGFVSDNPSSAEAIKASHENLRLTARKAQRTFGSGFLNVGYLAACVRDNFAFDRSQFYLTKPVWEPIFEPDASMISLIGDGAIKINQAVPGYFNRDNLGIITGLQPSDLPAPITPAQAEAGDM